MSQLAGMHLVLQSTGEFIVPGLVNTSQVLESLGVGIPWCWDDPIMPSLLWTPLVSVFDGIGSQTQRRREEQPLTSFILTVQTSNNRLQT